jgi:hypothetical protein
MSIDDARARDIALDVRDYVSSTRMVLLGAWNERRDERRRHGREIRSRGSG